MDFTREGESCIGDVENADIRNAEGVNFSVPGKSEMAGLLKQRMLNKQFYYPLLNWERPYRGDICTELNVERYDLRKDGLPAPFILFFPFFNTNRYTKCNLVEFSEYRLNH